MVEAVVAGAAEAGRRVAARPPVVGGADATLRCIRAAAE
eukprot:COSAG04_NODE_9787_length_832_cov_1.000000_1_plen_38_part_10